MSGYIQLAKKYATNRHEGQVRKYSNVPYVEHCFAVARIVEQFTDDEEVIVAAILHDTIEDTETTFTDIEVIFGYRVAKLVAGCTKPEFDKASTTRQFRNTQAWKHYASGGEDVFLIKLADAIHNCTEFIIYDPKYALKYCGEKRLCFTEFLTCKKYPIARAWLDNILEIGIHG